MNIVRPAAAAMLAVHGLIHLLGFVVPWQVVSVAGLPARTTVLAGAVELGELGSRAVGLAWLALAVGFLIAAIGIWRNGSWALAATGALAVGSLIVCVLGLPDTAFGIGIDIAILGLVGSVAWRRGSRGPNRTYAG